MNQRIKIIHETGYSFSEEVFLEPHYVRFRPRKTSSIELIDFSLLISPQPTGQRFIRDEENNLVDLCWFEGMTHHFTIKAQSVLGVRAYNPFGFILHPQSFDQIPFQYSADHKQLLFSSLQGLPLSRALVEYGVKILRESNHKTIDFLTNLTFQIHQDFLVEYREVGSPLLPDETFELKRGSCRDLSWMLVHLLRNQAIAARFVSGYFYFEMDTPSYELHAWVEVFLPGTGWMGIDPSHGILTGNTHFPITSSAHYKNTMTVSGAIRGNATSKLNTSLSIEKM